MAGGFGGLVGGFVRMFSFFFFLTNEKKKRSGSVQSTDALLREDDNKYPTVVN